MTTSIPAVSGNKANVTTAEYVKLVIFNEYSPTTAANITANTQYEIKTTGSTNWTAVGAPSNAVGTIFTATANGAAGSGDASNVTLLTFSSSYTSDTIGGIEYDPLGGLLAVGAQQRSLRVTSGDTSIQISGIGGNNIYEVLESQGKIRGSKVEITRGFFNNNLVLANAVVRFTGIVTNYSIQEDRDGVEDNYTITLDASSYKTVLENRIAGRKTNQSSWQFFDPTDSAMNNLNSLAGFSFDFGSDPKSKTVVPGYNGGGVPGGGSRSTTPSDTNPSNRK